MKTTKKLLIILCASALLVASVFSVGLGAVVSGEGTTMNEYLTMKLSEFENFEDNANSLFKQSVNYELAGSIVSADTKRMPPVNVYDEEGAYSHKYYYLDYSGNTGKADCYIQPVLGNLDNIDKTPANGFVAEFDVAFFSPVKYVMVDKTEQKKSESGDLLWIGEDGETEVIDKELAAVDEAGQPIPATKIVYKDEFDDEGNLIGTVPEQAPKEIYATDAEGKILFSDTGLPYKLKVVDETQPQPFEGLSNTLYMNLLNTVTSKDGAINVLVFTTHAAPTKPEDVVDGFTNGYIEMTLAKSAENLASTAGSYKFAPDEWKHITFQYDAKSLVMHIYLGTDNDKDSEGNVVGRTLFASISALDPVVENYGNQEKPVYPLRFRIGTSSNYGLVGFDNFLSYQGTTIHDPNKLEKMQKEDIIELFINTLLNEEVKPTLRYQAYVGLKENYMLETPPGSGSNEAINAKIDAYYEYENNVKPEGSDVGLLDALIVKVKEENAQTLRSYVDVVKSLDRTLDNITQRQVRISMAQDFHDSLGALVNREDPVYKSAAKDLAEQQAVVASDLAANQFIDSMTLYSNAVNFGASISRIKYHYEAAKAVRPAIANYEEFPSDSSSYANLKSATLMFDGDDESSTVSAEEYIKSQVLDDNSRRLVGLMEILSKTSAAEWANDDGTYENMWYIALTIIRDDGYNATYPGVENALGIYNNVNAYFWNALQRRHIDTLNAKLDEFNAEGSSYIFKAGACTYIDNYLLVNEKDIDPANTEIKAIKETAEAYKKQLDVLMGDYKNLLEQNTTKFINTMKLISLYTDYSDLKPLYDEATEYYYTMNLTNVNGENINDYTAQYDELRARMNIVEAANDAFLAVVNGTLTDAEGEAIYAPLNTLTSRSDLYRSLNACQDYLPLVDETYEGVTEALEIYNAKYNAYVGAANEVNEQLNETVNTTLSLRGNWDIDSVISFIKKLFVR
ncbi:MAG: hypothetical protein IJY18_00505 [Clostridia bacterium]|nr:hypothetical protein [Clostridia bacterium]